MNNTITGDGSRSDWAGITSEITEVTGDLDNGGNSAGYNLLCDILYFGVTRDTNFLYFLIEIDDGGAIADITYRVAVDYDNDFEFREQSDGDFTIGIQYKSGGWQT